jgi:hypothetical protein
MDIARLTPTEVGAAVARRVEERRALDGQILALWTTSIDPCLVELEAAGGRAHTLLRTREDGTHVKTQRLKSVLCFYLATGSGPTRGRSYALGADRIGTVQPLVAEDLGDRLFLLHARVMALGRRLSSIEEELARLVGLDLHIAPTG